MTKSFLYFVFSVLLVLPALAVITDRVQAETPKDKKLKVLFLCTGNSCRSQMAEGWAESLKSDKIEAYSAGIETHGLNPNAVRVMKEAGVDISHHKSQHINEFKDIPLDYVITVCGHADENCPVFPRSVKVVHHPFDDPPKLAKGFEKEEDKLNCYRKVRDEIKAYVASLPESLKTAKIKPYQGNEPALKTVPQKTSPKRGLFRRMRTAR
jgi:arsenate reductase